MKKVSYLILVLTLFVAMLTGCGEDRTYEYYEKTEENQWIFSKMREVYLWREKLKEPSRTTFFSTPSKFFSTILNSGDKASFFTDTVSAGSYGITFAVMRDPIGQRPSKTYALVLMVEPGSPADIAGIRRGTWISSVGGATFTTSKYSALQSGGSTTFVTEYIDFDDDEQKECWFPGDTLQVAAATDCTERALYLDSIYNVRSKNIGYIVLNNFNGEDFVEQTQNTLLHFAGEEVDEVVIDLRYCTDGSIENAAALASSFVEPELYGTPFCNLADAEGETDTTYCYSQQLASLYEKRLFIVTGNRTAATAELFIAALNNSRPMYDLITFGASTAGISTRTVRFQSPYGFAINPVTNYIALANSKLLATTPDYSLNEQQQITNIYPLGSEQEYILYNILYYSLNGALPGEAK